MKTAYEKISNLLGDLNITSQQYLALLDLIDDVRQEGYDVGYVDAVKNIGANYER